MKRNLTTALRASLGLLALGLMVSGAQACSLAAWDANPGGVNAPTAAEQDGSGVKRYAGRCGLGTGAAPSYVQESAQHANEGASTAPFHARFFVYTGYTAGSPTIFRALTGENGTGDSVVEINYNADNQNFAFRVNGADAGSTAAGTAPRNRWVRVQFTYQQGVAFTASTRTTAAGNVTTNLTGTVNGPAGAAGVGVQSVQLGLIAANGAAGQGYFDEYEASRAPIGDANALSARIRGDASGDGVCAAGDITAIARDVLFQDLGPGGTRVLAPGQPDCNEDGTVTSGDITCIARRLVANDLFDIPCD